MSVGCVSGCSICPSALRLGEEWIPVYLSAGEGFWEHKRVNFKKLQLNFENLEYPH